MQQSAGQRQATAPAVLGVLLILFGAGALLARASGVNVIEAVGPWGWPLFIIVPGLVLLAASLVPSRPNGIGFATAGAIVTTVGLLLLYQWRTDHFESWAYAWALLPGAAGLAQVAYGFFAAQREMVTRGAWMAVISAILFVAGAWFFEGIFAGSLRGVDAWPILLIVLGAIVAIRAFVGPRARSASLPTPVAGTPTVEIDPPG